MEQDNPFTNQFAVEVFDELVARIVDRLNIDEETAPLYMTSYTDDAYKHILHYVEALLGYFGNRPDFKFYIDDVIEFLDRIQNRLEQSGCTMTQKQVIAIFKDVYDMCRSECRAWTYILITTIRYGAESINERHYEKAMLYADAVDTLEDPLVLFDSEGEIAIHFEDEDAEDSLITAWDRYKYNR